MINYLKKIKKYLFILPALLFWGGLAYAIICENNNPPPYTSTGTYNVWNTPGCPGNYQSTPEAAAMCGDFISEIPIGSGNFYYEYAVCDTPNGPNTWLCDQYRIVDGVPYLLASDVAANYLTVSGICPANYTNIGGVCKDKDLIDGDTAFLDLGSTSLSRDGSGKLLSVTTGGRTWTVTARDGFGRISGYNHPDGYSVSVTYWGYSAMLKTVTMNVGGVNLVTEYTWMREGYPLSVKAPDGVYWNYEYDTSDKLIRVTASTVAGGYTVGQEATPLSIVPGATAQSVTLMGEARQLFSAQVSRADIFDTNGKDAKYPALHLISTNQPDSVKPSIKLLPLDMPIGEVLPDLVTCDNVLQAPKEKDPNATVCEEDLVANIDYCVENTIPYGPMPFAWGVACYGDALMAYNTCKSTGMRQRYRGEKESEIAPHSFEWDDPGMKNDLANYAPCAQLCRQVYFYNGVLRSNCIKQCMNDYLKPIS